MKLIKRLGGSSVNKDVSSARALYRFVMKRCLDCGGKVTRRGDVCKKCFDAFNGLSVEELTGHLTEANQL
jgi:hypothetical protein